MHIRKLVKAGAASHTVSLPKEWLEKNRLKKGDSVFISEKSDSELVITPKAEESRLPEKEITISIDGKSMGRIQREITSAYVNNFSRIHLAGDSVPESAKALRSIINHFVALEIDEQTGRKISAKDLLNLEEISVQSTIKRMDMTLRSIMQDSMKELGSRSMRESVEQRDDDVNRLYFLLFRILKSALEDSRIAAKIGMSNSSIMSMWYLAVNIENLADSAKTVSHLSDKVNDRQLLKEAYSEIEAAYLEAMKAYYSGDKETADSVASKRLDIFSKCTKLLIKTPTAGAAEVIENLKAMATYTCNIARIVMDS